MTLPVLSGTGRLTADPDLKFSQNGTAVAKVPLAFNARRKNEQTGQWEDGDAFFVTGAVFKDAAEQAAEQLRKGTEVNVTGRLKTRSWDDNGTRRSVAELLIDSIGPTLREGAKKAERRGQDSRGQGGGFGGSREPDPWASDVGSGGYSDEPPF